MMTHTNIEVKAKFDDHNYVRNILEEQSAKMKGIDHQIDTYFNVPHGRLKLREGDLEQYLIHYHRSNQNQPKQSNIHLYETGENALVLKNVLAAALGIDITVEKEREIYFVDNVKFHLDKVDDLGHFIEIEAISENGDIELDRLRDQCEQYIDLLNISENDLISVSYSDLLR